MKKTPGDIILHKCTINDNYMIYGSWDMKYNKHNFLSFLAIFALLPPPPPLFLSFWAIPFPFNPLTAQKMKISKKWKKKMPADMIILHTCPKNNDHMLHCSWDMARGRCNCYFSFWAIFCHFTPLTAQKMKTKKMKNKPGDIIILHICTKNYD